MPSVVIKHVAIIEGVVRLESTQVVVSLPIVHWCASSAALSAESVQAVPALEPPAPELLLDVVEPLVLVEPLVEPLVLDVVEPLELVLWVPLVLVVVEVLPDAPVPVEDPPPPHARRITGGAAAAAT